jgi:hypothetical protein
LLLIGYCSTEGIFSSFSSHFIEPGVSKSEATEFFCVGGRDSTMPHSIKKGVCHYPPHMPFFLKKAGGGGKS